MNLMIGELISKNQGQWSESISAKEPETYRIYLNS